MGCKILIEAQRGRPEGKPAARVFWILSISEFYQVSYEVIKLQGFLKVETESTNTCTWRKCLRECG
jgi:hypothetical protein